MNALDHLRRYPNARPSTIAALVERERTHAKLRAEVLKLRRKERIARIKRALWPSWVWR
ncbi:hypothetical protein [Aquamicrobium defluvii]|uniref:hypothetical protein n=1 Tax=Aquamicrobium defluvii TaxID=69279 RepID=UPI0004B219B3|nr:hypothetical protein [Aquamicrobium defluvii]